MYTKNTVYMYMKSVPVPGLCMVDDIVTVNLCNDVHGIEANVQVDSFVRSKKLECQTGSGKCQWVHIGNDNCPSKYYVNNQPTDQAEQYKYLGDVLFCTNQEKERRTDTEQCVYPLQLKHL